MNKTKIEWADATWNPVTGCLHGCEYCYARKIANRFGGFMPWENPEGGRHITKTPTDEIVELDGMEARVQKNGKVVPAPYPYGFKPTLHRYRLDEPGRCKKSRTIFVCSMADLFGDWVPDEWIKSVFEACAKAPQHRYMFLTKNPDRYWKLRAAGLLPRQKGFWYGITATNHQQAEAAFRYIPNGWDGFNIFLSAEPLYGEINVPALVNWPRLVILGAETGNRKGKTLPHRLWVEGTANRAKSIGAAVFMKDSLLPVVGEENIRREFPWEAAQA